MIFAQGPNPPVSRQWSISMLLPYIYVASMRARNSLCSAKYTLTVKDSDETVVFSTYIPEGTYTAVLPSTLSGNYILQLSDDTYVYEGEIEL